MDADILRMHESFIVELGNNYCALEGRRFIINKMNENILRALLFYFNGDDRIIDFYPNMSLHKNILLIGPPGTGKTLIMQIFSEYLRRLQNPNRYICVSSTQMANHYKVYSNIDAFTYNIKDKKLEGAPLHLCLNDIGIEMNQKSYGTDIESLIDEFLFARYEIFQNQRKKTHLTSNLNISDFKSKYEPRILDRFKAYNVLALEGNSFRR